MFGVNLKAAKGMFFDRTIIMGAVDKGTRKVLSKFGAFVRQRSRTSIRKRKGTAPAGTPPFSHEGSLRKLILFGYDTDRRSVVIGPTLSERATGAPANLEYGGSADLKGRGKNRDRKVRVPIRPHPFMGPAFEKEKAGLPALWRDSIT